MTEFVRYRREFLRGDEKGEAQIFSEALFRAFGHAVVRQAGATLEQRIKKQDAKGTAFADLMWKPRLPDRDEEDRGRPGAGVPPGV